MGLITDEPLDVGWLLAYLPVVLAWICLLFGLWTLRNAGAWPFPRRLIFGAATRRRRAWLAFLLAVIPAGLSALLYLRFVLVLGYDFILDVWWRDYAYLLLGLSLLDCIGVPFAIYAKEGGLDFWLSDRKLGSLTGAE